MKIKPKTVVLTKSGLIKLLRKATGFCQWDEYEKGYKLRDKQTILGVDYFIDSLKNEKSDYRRERREIYYEIKYTKLYKVIREIIDDSYWLYYNANGTFRKDKCTSAEKNEIANRFYKELVIDFDNVHRIVLEQTKV